jgi:hypothetical protein
MRLDNETSTELEEFFQLEMNIDYQLSPPTNHRANQAERAIRTAKNHLISIIANADQNSPAYLWELYLVQCSLTLNHLLSYKPDPTKSAYHGIHGERFDFKKHPLAPLGCKVLVFEDPGSRQTWAPHGVSGFYVGPALKHYRCYIAYISATRSLRVTDTMDVIIAPVKLPGSTVAEILLTKLDNISINQENSNLVSEIKELIQTNKEGPFSCLVNQRMPISENNSNIKNVFNDSSQDFLVSSDITKSSTLNMNNDITPISIDIVPRRSDRKCSKPSRYINFISENCYLPKSDMSVLNKNGINAVAMITSGIKYTVKSAMSESRTSPMGKCSS